MVLGFIIYKEISIIHDRLPLQDVVETHLQLPARLGGGGSTGSKESQRTSKYNANPGNFRKVFPKRLYL